MSQTGVTDWQQITTKHMLPNISESKDNQAMEFDHLTDHNMRNIFLQKSCKRWGRETSFRPLFVF